MVDKKKKETEKVDEVFEITKNNKTKEIVKKAEVNLKHATKQQKDYQGKVLNWVLAGVIIVLIFFILSVFFINNLKTIDYKGIKFEKEKAGNVMFYKTSFLVFRNNTNLTYNLYLRTDPRTFDKINFNGTMHAKQIVVLNSTNSLNCNGDGIIALANIYQLFPYIGLELLKDPNATCDNQDRYMFVNIINSSQTSIEQTGKSCYQINVNNCEILAGTEKFMIEVLLKRKELMSGK